MIFPYIPDIVYSPEDGEPDAIVRPIIPVELRGPKGTGNFFALVDTGADYSILPKRIADALGISLLPSAGPALVALGGQELNVFYGEVQLQLAADQETLIWNLQAQFYDYPQGTDESLVLGFIGFLEFLNAFFDSENETLTITPNAFFSPT